MQIIWSDLDDFNDEGFIALIGFANPFYEYGWDNTNIVDEGYESNDNENLQKAYNKLFEELLT